MRFVDGAVAEFAEHGDQEFAVDFVVFGNEEGKGMAMGEVSVDDGVGEGFANGAGAG